MSALGCGSGQSRPLHPTTALADKQTLGGVSLNGCSGWRIQPFVAFVMNFRSRIRTFQVKIFLRDNSVLDSTENIHNHFGTRLCVEQRNRHDPA
jgi:hypothetical protein